MRCTVVVALCAMFMAAACGKVGDTTDGTRGQCATGGALNQCPPAERTAEGACWRLVDCGAIPLAADPDYVFDWGACVDAIESAPTIAQQLVIDCIAASSCDELDTNDNPQRPDPKKMYCLQMGGL